jgi:hypothetical protein
VVYSQEAEVEPSMTALEVVLVEVEVASLVAEAVAWRP